MPYKDPEKRRELGRKHYAANKETYLQNQRDRRGHTKRFVEEYKTENNVCVDCLVAYPHYVLDFDHVPERGPKVGHIAVMCKHSTIETILLEIAKCDIVCSNCHRIRTWKRKMER